MTTIDEIKARRDEYEDVRYQSYSGDLTEDASVDFDYLISSIENMAPVLQTYRDEVARLQAECAALAVDRDAYKAWTVRLTDENAAKDKIIASFEHAFGVLGNDSTR